MKEKRKSEIRSMSEAIDQPAPNARKFPFEKGMEGIERKKVGDKLKTADEIIGTARIDIPKCLTIPSNGRIFVVEVTGSESRTPSGLIIPHKLQMKKNEEVKDACRYFVVAWDPDDVPEKLQNRLRVGMEVNPFLPTNAEEWELPRVIDWNTGNVFKCIHYTELAGISSVEPVEVQK